ncbi:hypothetical protein [Actinoallomurus acaciae]|uniref:Uncharacterized protein n=1 Tax=Actinoallomurus acaciae TaxID=502577 RepID=A0ABV5Y7K5_9ACTN
MSTYDEFDELDELILETKASVIAKLNAATDFDAVLADIYAKGGLAESVESIGAFTDPAGVRDREEMRGGVEAVGDHIDMLQAVLVAAAKSEEKSPLMGTVYLSTARQSLWRLRDGLTTRRLSKTAAMRLVSQVEHNLREIDRILRRQHGLSLDEALHDRIGELMELGGDIADQIRILHEKVVQLFDDAADSAVLTPVPHG